MRQDFGWKTVVLFLIFEFRGNRVMVEILYCLLPAVGLFIVAVLVGLFADAFSKKGDIPNLGPIFEIAIIGAVLLYVVMQLYIR